MTRNRRALGQTHLPLWAAGFVALACVAILALSGWREWSARDAELKNAEIDMANLAESLAQHADDTFELVDNVLTGVVNRLEVDGTGPDAIARLQTFIDLRKLSLGRIRGLFVYDETGKWLATTADVYLRGLNNSDRDSCMTDQPGNRDKSATPPISIWTLRSSASRLLRLSRFSSMTMIFSKNSSTAPESPVSARKASA